MRKAASAMSRFSKPWRGTFAEELAVRSHPTQIREYIRNQEKLDRGYDQAELSFDR